jgi:hypothetical protein
MAKLEYLEYAAHSPIDSGRHKSLVNDATTSFDKHRGYVRAIRELGGGRSPAEFATPTLILAHWQIPRDSLLSKSNWGRGFGEMVGEELAKREAMQICACAEAASRPLNSPLTLADLQDKVRIAIAELANRGFQASIILIPIEARFAASLFRKPLWQLTERHELGPQFYGKFDGVPVARWPYTDPQSIVIADAASFFGAVDGATRPLVAEIGDPDEHQTAELLRSAAVGPMFAALPDPSSIVLPLALRTIPALGVANAEAAVSLSLKDCDGCYALPANEDKYHRPSCDLIDPEDGVVFSLAKRRAGERQDREPCTSCRPDRWNSEARLGSGNVPPLS